MPNDEQIHWPFISTIRNNSYFFTGFTIFLLIGGITLLLIEQGDLLLFFSENRTYFGDAFFRNLTKAGEELSYLGLVILFLFIHFRVALLIPVTGIIVSVISYLTKAFFLHPRPSVYYKNLGKLGEINLVEGVDLLGGATSFPSGHTMSAFALFALVALFFKNKKWLGIVLFVAAFGVGLSRIYLVQHFFQDIYMGAIIGVLIALAIFEIQAIFPNKPTNFLDKKLFRLKAIGIE